MNLAVAIPAFIVAIGVLVTIHELGHYLAARACGVKVLRFSIGFGRPLWLKRIGPDQTEWVVAALPLGGYVLMAGERGQPDLPGEEGRSFHLKPVWQRMFIVAAGPLANFLLAALLYWVLLVAGIPGVKPFVADPATGTPAAQAGFQPADLVTRIGDRAVRTWNDARLAMIEAAVDRRPVEVAVTEPSGREVVRTLDFSGITKDDLDRDFLGKLGVQPYYGRVTTTIDRVAPGSPAERAGIRAGDRVTGVDGRPLARWIDFVMVARASPGKPIVLTLVRDGEARTATVTPEAVAEAGTTVGRVGLGTRLEPMDRELLSTTVREGPLAAIPRAFAKVWEMSVFSLRMMGRMITGDVSWKNLSGPITIADYAGQSALLGWMTYVNFLALISISLGVLNLLPVPVLDGGQLMYHMAEIFKGSPVSDRTIEIGQQVGLALLLGLTAFAFYNDIHRLLTG